MKGILIYLVTTPMAQMFSDWHVYSRMRSDIKSLENRMNSLYQRMFVLTTNPDVNMKNPGVCITMVASRDYQFRVQDFGYNIYCPAFNKGLGHECDENCKYYSVRQQYAKLCAEYKQLNHQKKLFWNSKFNGR